MFGRLGNPLILLLFLARWTTISLWIVFILVTIKTTSVEAFNQNPVPGSIWTYMGPTYGADWQAFNLFLNCSNILVYGGVRDGTTDNTVALNTAIASNPTHPCVYFPQGRYAFSAQFVYNLNAPNRSIAFVGDGSTISEIIFTNGGGFRIVGSATKTSFQFQGLSVLTHATNTGTGIDIDYGTFHNDSIGANNFVDLLISGDDVGNLATTHWWAKGIRLNGIGNVNFYAVNFYGESNSNNGTAYTSRCLEITAPPTNLSFIYNITSSNFFGCKYGLYYGANVQGTNIVNSNFTLNFYGIYFPSDSVGQSGFNIMTSQLDNFNRGIFVDAGASTPQIEIVNNIFFIRNNAIGIQFTGAVGWFLIGDNQCAASTATNPQNGGCVDVNNGVGMNKIRNTVCVHLDECVHLRSGQNSTFVSGSKNDTSGTKMSTINDSHLSNVVTGFVGTPSFEQFFADALNVSAVANNGSGLIRVTVADTTHFTNGQVIFSNLPGIGNQPGIYVIDIIDATHIDFRASVFSAAYTGGGAIWTMPGEN